MQYKKFAFITVVLMALVSLWSCEYEKIEPKPPTTDTVHYGAQIQPIFTSGTAGGCLGGGCHDTGAVPPDLTEGKSYNALMSGNFVNVGDPASSKLYQKISTGTMKQYSSSDETSLILVWIQQGAKNN